MPFQETAKKIINSSIRNVLYIDEQIALPFDEPNTTNLDHISRCKGLYDSFKANNSYIDFYRYTSDGEWQTELATKWANTDLLLLDWELKTVGVRYRPALEILTEAIGSPNLHFVCIYTQANDFENILYQIAAYYSDTRSKLAQLQNIANTYHLEDANNDLLGVFKELTFYKTTDKDARISALVSGITEVVQNIASFRNSLKSVFCNDYIKGLEHLGFYLAGDKVVLPENPLQKEVAIYKGADGEASYNFAIIDNTIVGVFQKTVTPTNLFEAFRNALIKHTPNFLTFLSLEMRNIFLRSSAFAEKDLASIDEKAFFYFQEKSFTENSDSFYDTLKTLWKEQMVSFSQTPELFNELGDYKSIRDITVIDNYPTDRNANNNLAQINVVLNTLRIEVDSRNNDILRFGDVFYYSINEENINGENINEKTRYLLCITPHCDCQMAATKISHNFYFVEGEKMRLQTALENADSKFVSFFKGSPPFCISWAGSDSVSCKPFTIHIANNKLLPDGIDTSISEMVKINEVYTSRITNVKLHHLGTLKENYAQRIANHAFGYPLRVGIDFAKI